MNALVQGLAALGGLRDRDTLDTELVRLVVRHAGLGVTRADLIRVLGDGDEQRCLALATMRHDQDQPTHDVLWSDWTQLPHLMDFPLRVRAFEKGRAMQEDQPAPVAVLPMGTRDGLRILLEVTSAKPLSPRRVDLLQSVLLAYLPQRQVIRNSDSIPTVTLPTSDTAKVLVPEQRTHGN